ncbi:MAG TPA: hypothetical protein DF712_06785 [Balneola sp.]|mgnify:CR=1 FL=1|nr:hypothetical protein [Balneola sp.]
MIIGSCLTILALLAPYEPHLKEERIQVCTSLIKEAKSVGVDPALTLAVAWVESNWEEKREPTKSKCFGAMQIKIKYWCPPLTGEWKPTQTNGKLKGCDPIKRGVFALEYYLKRFKTRNKAISCYGGDCADKDYLNKVLGKYRIIKKRLK